VETILTLAHIRISFYLFPVNIRGRLKSTQMTQMMWICTDKNEAYKTKEVDYP
jgi:hypothetical protein